MTNHEIQSRIDEIISNIRAAESLSFHAFEARRRLHESTRSHQNALAVEFGARHGWTVGSAFSVRTLREGARTTGRLYDTRGGWDQAFADHPFFYRLNGRAAALAAHLFGSTAGADEWAQRAGLVVKRPNFPSWWYPGRTTLIVFEHSPVTFKRWMASQCKGKEASHYVC